MRETSGVMTSGFVLGLSGLLLLALGAPACGDDGGTGAAARPVPATAALATAICARFDRCSPGFVTGNFADASACVASFQSSYATSLGAAGVTTTQVDVDACTTALGSATCAADGIGEIPACNFAGSLPSGTACAVDAQCESGSCVRARLGGGETEAECGTCTARAPVGGDCSAADCAVGLDCSLETRKCATRLGEGAVCDGRVRCGGNLRCIDEACVKPIPKDGACSEEQNDPGCERGLSCVEGVCALPKSTVTGKLGERCGVDLETATVVNCINADCVGKTGAKTCVAFVPVGQPCTADGPSCQSFAECKNGTCAVADPAVCK